MKFTSVRKFACVLSLTSIFSIGFASWTMTTPEIKPVSVTGGLQTDYVIKADDYVVFDNLDTATADDGVVLPEYNQGGFVTTITQEGKTIYTNSSTAYMVLYLGVNSDKCKELVARGETKMDITITFTLESKAKEFFNDTISLSLNEDESSVGSAKPSVTQNTTKVNGETVTIGYTVTLKGYNFEKLTADGEIRLTFNLDATGKEEAIEDCLNGDTLILNMRVYSYKQ